MNESSRTSARLGLPLALVLGLMSTPAFAQRQSAPLAAVEGEVIVAFKPDASTLRKHALAARADGAATLAALQGRATTLGARVGRVLQAGAAVGEHVQVLRASGVDTATLARQLAADPEVLYAVPNGRKRRVAAPNDPLYAAATRPNGPDSGQWYLRAPDSTIRSAIDIETAWARTAGSASVVVAVLDTGVRFDHPDLGRVANGGQLLPGYDFITDTDVANDGGGRDSDPSDPGDWITAAEARTSTFSGCAVSSSSWHGTSTASLIGAAANNATGMAGAAPGVRLLPVRVLGKCSGYDSDILPAMRWAAGLSVPGVPANPNPARVINMSLGGDGACSAAYQAAINEITAAGVLVVASAGNSAGHPVSEPANCVGVVGVAALRHVGSKVGFSDMGPQISIAAPGGNCVNIATGSACLYPILAATNTGTTGPVASGYTDSFNITVGTSFSAPLVAAVAALMVSQRPTLTPAQVRSTMMASATAFPTTGAGNGTNGQPVPVCPAPVAGVDQDQCYCTTSTCGAGMLDAGRAVTAVAGALARIEVSPASPTPGAAVNFSGANSLPGPGATVSGYAWSIVSGGGIVTTFSSATNASTAAITPSGPGNFTVQLTVTDSAGGSNTTTTTVTVAAAAGNPPASGGGGGAVSALWVAGVGLAAFVLGALRVRRLRAVPTHKA